ncbi:MAG: response regulator [Planctomycetes bacterium]|nr:response regulator [Planctomycetota bacterium]
MTSNSHRTKVLIIDDDPGIRTTLKFMLSPYKDFDVIFASNGLDGVKKVSEEYPQVVIIDLMLPDVHGADIAEEVRHEYKRVSKNVKLLAISALRSDDAIDLAARAGFDDFITKPFHAPTLIDLIYKYIGKPGRKSKS